MNAKNSIQNLLRRFSKPNQNLRTNLVRPQRDWFIGLFAFFILFLAGCEYAYYTFNVFSKLESTIETPAQTVTAYAERDVAKVLAEFRAKAAAFSAIEPDNAPEILPASAITTPTSSPPTIEAEPSEAVEEISTSTPPTSLQLE